MYICVYIFTLDLNGKSPFSVLALYKHFHINNANWKNTTQIRSPRNFKKTQQLRSRRRTRLRKPWYISVFVLEMVKFYSSEQHFIVENSVPSISLSMLTWFWIQLYFWFWLKILFLYLYSNIFFLWFFVIQKQAPIYSVAASDLL